MAPLDLFRDPADWPAGMASELRDHEQARDRALAQVPRGPDQGAQVQGIHDQTWDAMVALWALLGAPHLQRVSCSEAQAAQWAEGPLISVMDLWAPCRVLDARIQHQGAAHVPWALWGRPTQTELVDRWGAPDHRALGTAVWWFHLVGHPLLSPETAWWVSATDHPRHLRAGAHLPVQGVALQVSSQHQVTWGSVPLALWWTSLARAFTDSTLPQGWALHPVQPWPVETLSSQ